jgi:hypothetical protein
LVKNRHLGGVLLRLAHGRDDEPDGGSGDALQHGQQEDPDDGALRRDLRGADLMNLYFSRIFLTKN